MLTFNIFPEIFLFRENVMEILKEIDILGVKARGRGCSVSEVCDTDHQEGRELPKPGMGGGSGKGSHTFRRYNYCKVL